MRERIFLSPPWMGGSERERVEEAFASGYIAPCGPMVERFEKDFAQRVGLPCACALTSCSAALDVLFHELGIQKGDRVFCSDVTFVASIASAVRRGAEPVFIDSDETSWTLDPGLLGEALAGARRANALPKAVIAVDLYGQCCDYDRIESVCGMYGVPLIIDAAESVGATYRRRPAGCAGWASAYSFNGNKIITTSGGGMVASRDAGVVERARRRAQQAREPEAWYEHAELGYNYRMSNIVAAVGVGQLGHLDEIVAKKRQIFEWYRERLEGVPGMWFMPEAAYGRCSRWLTVACLDQGAAERVAGVPSEAVMRVVGALEKANIEARPVWKPMHLQPVFRGAEVFGGRVGERLFANGFCLPSGAGLEEKEVEVVSSLVRECMTA